MIKTLAYFPSQCALNSGPVLQAITESLRKTGIKLVADSMQADAALIWSVLWHGRMAKNQQVYEHYRGQGRPVVVIDIGTLRRGITWKMALNHVNALGDYGLDGWLDPDRPSKLGVCIKDQLVRRPEILIAGQHRHSLQVQGVDLEHWICTIYQQLRDHTDRLVLLRSHPRSRLDPARLPADLVDQRPQPLPGTYDDFDFDSSYHAVVNYNSGPGILAALAGVPTIVDETSLAWPVSISISDVEKPPLIDRHQWLTKIAHTEYTLDEIKDGLWLKRLIPRMQESI